MTAPDTYFADPTGTPTEDGRFYRVDQLAAVEIVSGLTLRPIVSTDTMLSFARYEPFAEAPRHAHVEAQIFVMLEGEMEVELGDEVHTMRPGDVAVVPSWLPHRATAGPARAYQLDIFNPPRAGVLEQIAADQPKRSDD